MGHLGSIVFWGFLAIVVISGAISLFQDKDFDESVCTFFVGVGVGLVGLGVYFIVWLCTR